MCVCKRLLLFPSDTGACDQVSTGWLIVFFFFPLIFFVHNLNMVIVLLVTCGLGNLSFLGILES